MSVDQTRPLPGVTKHKANSPQNDPRFWVRWPSIVGKSSELETLCKAILRKRVHSLLVFAPLGIVAGTLDWKPTLVLIFNALAITPFSSLLNLAAGELSPYLGPLGGWLNGVFGSPIDLIIGIIALVKGEIRLLQSSMLGAILFNILFVLGSAFLAGGIKFKEQKFNHTFASTVSSIMTLASASLVLPATFAASMDSQDDQIKEAVSVLSHGTAIILLFTYFFYLFFRMRSHQELFASEAEVDEDNQPEHQTLAPLAAGFIILVSSAIVAVCAVFLIDSIDFVVESSTLSKNFFGVLVIPLIGNLAEVTRTCRAARKNNMDFVITLALGNSMQVALFVTPFLVTLGWIINQPMTFNFSDFETVMFFISVVVVCYLIQDGKSNYLEGLMCLGVYIIIIIAVYILPDGDNNIRGFMALFKPA